MLDLLVQGMEELLKFPKVLCGGGCTETLLAYYISQWVRVCVVISLACKLLLSLVE